MMEEQLSRFPSQFAFVPAVENAEALPAGPKHLIVCGMGGSALGARLLLRHDPTLDISVHSDYGLPRESAERLREGLIVASSYSGETEEVLDAAKAALDAGYSLAVVTTGGALGALAQERKLPLIMLPRAEMEPRMAVGASMLALARLMQDPGLEGAIREAGSRIDPAAGRAAGEKLAAELAGQLPIVYASRLNSSLAHFWKIALNETAKIPAFANVFPEVCHNELSGFDVVEATRSISGNMHAVFLLDGEDHPRVTKRMKLMKDLLSERGIGHSKLDVVGGSALEKTFNTILASTWAALALAKSYGVPDAATPLIEEFKKQMRGA